MYIYYASAGGEKSPLRKGLLFLFFFYLKAVTLRFPASDNILMRISYRVIVLILCNRYNVWEVVVSQCNNKKYYTN